MQAVLTVSKLASLMGVSDRYVRMKIDRGEIKGQQTQTAEGRGRRGYVIPVSTLSVELQRKFWTSDAEAAQEIAPEPETPAKQDDLQPGINYTLAELKNAVGEAKFESMLQEAEAKLSIIKEAMNPPDGVERTYWINTLANRYGRSAATLYRDIERYQEFGVLGLMRKNRLLTQGPQRSSIDEEVEKLIRAMYLARTKPKPAHIFRETLKICETKGYRPPSRASVFRYLADMEQFEPDLCCYAREGDETYWKRFAEKASRKEPDFVNQVWMGDHHKLDLFIAYQGKAVRPWMTVWFDVTSRVVVGWTLAINANGRTIALALRNAMLPKRIQGEDGAEDVLEIGGIPGMLYIDNGEDYKAQMRQGREHEGWELSRETRGICASLDIKVQFATPYHPWAKGQVERFFGTFTDQFARYQPGWCGANNKARPEGFDEKALLAKGQLMDLDELTERVETYLYEYHMTEHRTLGMTPLQKHFSVPKIRPGFADERALDICLMDVDKAAVTANGIERFGTRGKKRYYWHPELPAYAGQKVIIRYDPNRIGELLIFHPKTGRYLFSATNKELLAFDASKDDIKELEKRRSQQRKLIRQTLLQTRASVESITNERKAAGTRVTTAKNTPAVGNVRPMLGTEQVVRQRDDEAKKSKMKRQDKASVFEDYILREGTEG
ncbi:Mu transposase C-terminal domain-containing protein [Cohnella nanjingensis]|uniref:DDE-type integrase/transposase/recombinase n=1 Tax=Cohnella nanjingensis TaxID=1387779 RepID=A0A7X0RV74_9BACL|nr:Mu transposase C-terminal domain-containing protein [Cohnella nanjingensis]MBB6672990.1 DDE-type integrase/transposase/recombinase [Cohnella nanjingensis]